MKFKRTDIIDAIEKRIKTIEDANATALRKHEWGVADAARKWRVENRQKWLDFAEQITVCMMDSNSDVITAEDLPKNGESRGWSDRLAVFNKPFDSYKPVSTDSLESAKAVLEASPDEYITSSGLKEIGFKDINRLMGSVPS